MNIVISVGNTDNKLTQQEFSNYVKQIDALVETYCTQKHFFGGSNTYDAWQNVTWLCDIEQINLGNLEVHLSFARRYFKQDSIFFLSGVGKFI